MVGPRVISGLLVALALSGFFSAPVEAASLDPLEVLTAAAEDDTVLLIVQNTSETVMQNVSVAWEEADGTARSLTVPTTPPGVVLTLPLVGQWPPGPHVVSVHYVSSRDAAFARTQEIVVHIEAAADGISAFVPTKDQVEVEFEGARADEGPNTTFAWVVLVGAVAAMPLELAYGVYRRKKREEVRPAETAGGPAKDDRKS